MGSEIPITKEITAPTVLIKGKWIDERIKGMLREWIRMFPHEVQEFGEYVQALRDNAQFKGTYTNVIYNSKEKTHAYEMIVHPRINNAMVNLFNSMWMDDEEIMIHFINLYEIGLVNKNKGRKGPNESRKG